MILTIIISFLIIWVFCIIAFIFDDFSNYKMAIRTWDKTIAKQRMKNKIKATYLKSIIMSIALTSGIWLIIWFIYFAVIGILNTKF